MLYIRVWVTIGTMECLTQTQTQTLSLSVNRPFQYVVMWQNLQTFSGRKNFTLYQLIAQHKGPFTPSESGCESEEDQRLIGRDQRQKFKHQRKISLSRALSFGVNRP